MAALELFAREHVVGVFRGFKEGGLEFHAELVLPYRSDFQRAPMHGQFLLVHLETPQEAVLGRITAFSSEGRLSYASGEEFNIRAVREQREIPEDLREDYLRYRVDIRVLGVVRSGAEERLTFVPSHRRLPHVGSRVAFPSGEVLREIAGHNGDGQRSGTLRWASTSTRRSLRRATRGARRGTAHDRQRPERMAASRACRGCSSNRLK